MERPNPSLRDLFPGTPGFSHPEAFRIMLYKSKDGEVVESIWNSRDGVTPFLVGVRDDQDRRMMQHVQWGGDPLALWHVPNIGDRIFVDRTEELSLAEAKRYVERCWESDQLAAEFETQTAAIDHYAEMSAGEECPCCVVVDQALQAEFVHRRNAEEQRVHAERESGPHRRTK